MIICVFYYLFWRLMFSHFAIACDFDRIILNILINFMSLGVAHIFSSVLYVIKFNVSRAVSYSNASQNYNKKIKITFFQLVIAT